MATDCLFALEFKLYCTSSKSAFCSIAFLSSISSRSEGQTAILLCISCLISSSRAAIRWSSWFSSLYDASPSIILFTSSIFALFASKYYRSLLATLSFMSRCISLSIALHSILVATSATVLLTSAIFALRESAFASSCLLHREWTYRSNS